MQDVQALPGPQNVAPVPASALTPSSVGGPPPVPSSATKPKLNITKTDRPTRSPTPLPEQPQPASSSSSSAQPTSQHGVLKLRSPLQLRGGRMLPQGTVIELGKKTRQTNEIEVKAAGERHFTLVSVDSLQRALGELEDPSDLDL